MTHYGIICPASTGHLNTMLPLGNELKRRGHRVTVVGLLDAQPKTLAAGLEFRAIADSEFPVGVTAESLVKLGKLSGLAAFRYTVNLIKEGVAVGLRDAPGVIKSAGVEAFTHAGMNTTLESLTNGVPMVAIPIANDQPGIAARIAWTGAGEFVPLSRLSVPRLQAAIQRVLTEDSYKNNASRLQDAIARAGGVHRATDIVEQAISTGKQVLAPRSQ